MATITISVPSDYPPLEPNAPIQIPFHFCDGARIELAPEDVSMTSDYAPLYRLVTKELRGIFRKHEIGVSSYGLYSTVENSLLGPGELVKSSPSPTNLTSTRNI